MTLRQRLPEDRHRAAWPFAPSVTGVSDDDRAVIAWRPTNGRPEIKRGKSDGIVHGAASSPTRLISGTRSSWWQQPSSGSKNRFVSFSSSKAANR
ncbi:hypothetical protein Pan189_27940 [Stratiformator vulcanicus]|uniref:Uncharacterized protein n=1 Tax=Stratiformator vulcanicus TaxID=2527980 RepID=A0A517R3E4_9PLAN|nr:hypothetical protein Pan189_27940 [Stratiformator vulcanicus]